MLHVNIRLLLLLAAVTTAMIYIYIKYPSGNTTIKSPPFFNHNYNIMPTGELTDIAFLKKWLIIVYI